MVKDTEIEKQRSSLKTLAEENKNLRKQLDKFKDAYQSHDTLKLINECRMNSKKRLVDEVEEEKEEVVD